MQTDMEKLLWRMLYKSQIALAKRMLSDMNKNAKDKEWPCGMSWNQCNGSSHAIFFRSARIEAGIDHENYLSILRNDEHALEIAEEELERADKQPTA